MPAGGSYIGATESPGSGSRPLYHHSVNITAKVQKGRNTTGLLPRNQINRVKPPGSLRMPLGIKMSMVIPPRMGSGLLVSNETSEPRTTALAPRSPGRPRKSDQRGKIIDRHRPIIASHVPVELVVIFEEAHAVTNGVVDFDRAIRVDRVGNKNFKV